MELNKLPEVLLLGPGPSPVHKRVLEAMSCHTLGHLDPDFMTIMNETTELLRYVFETDNRITFPVSGTGSAGMEAALVNTLEPGDKAVILVKGVFGERMAEGASRSGAEVIEVKAEWGQPVEPDALKKALSANNKIKMVGVIHAETSTGVEQPLEPLAKLAHQHEALFLVDTVTSLGGLPVAVDKRDLDIVYSGAQKCLGAPPGLAPITFNERALAQFEKRKAKVQSWYLDLSFLTRYWGDERFYHHTAPINMIYALYEALKMIKEEGLEKRFQRHRLNSSALIFGLSTMGVRPVVSEEYRLPSLLAVWVPEDVDDIEVRSRLRREHLIEIGGGLGPLKGKIWRIGMMGNGSNLTNIERLIKSLGKVLNELGHKCSIEEALSTSQTRGQGLV
ncbi:MAG: alanine--glyoxylate aminotransferase family protein [Bacillota bacterium]|nr:alanine--glyoxylate aminotransferase family protein [Bacillota bacterium]